MSTVPVPQNICDKNVKIMSDKLDKIEEKVISFELSVTTQIASLPGILRKEFDSLYADKRTEQTVDKFIWLVFSSTLVTILGLAGSVVLLIKYLA